MNKFSLKLDKMDISHSQIIFLKGESNYTRIFLENGKVLMSPYTLKSFDKDLCQHCFIRINRNLTVNLDYLKTFDADSVVLRNDVLLKISRRKKTSVLSKIGFRYQ